MTLCSLRLLPTLRGRNNLSFDIKLKSEKYLLMEISRGEKRHWGMKKEKRKRPKKKERIPFYQENRKILDESNWYSTPRWRPDEVSV